MSIIIALRPKTCRVIKGIERVEIWIKCFVRFASSTSLHSFLFAGLWQNNIFREVDTTPPQRSNIRCALSKNWNKQKARSSYPARAVYFTVVAPLTLLQLPPKFSKRLALVVLNWRLEEFFLACSSFNLNKHVDLVVLISSVFIKVGRIFVTVQL